MTTLVEAADFITKRFRTLWGVTTTIALDNKEIDIKTLTEWVRLSIRNIDSGQETLGPTGVRNFERKGIAFVQIFTEQGSGTKRANELAQIVRDIFEGVKFNDIVVDDVLINEIGIDGRWYQVNTESHFKYFEIK